MKKGAEIQIFGRVQGVWFRGSTQKRARELGLKGWVQNEPDGSVRLQAFGKENSLDVLEEWCRQGPPHARVSAVNRQEVAYEIHTDFVIKR